MRQEYLEAKVTTASQAELQLMLLDGALRHGNLARAAMLDEAQIVRYTAAISKMLDILETLVQSAAGGQHEISASVADQFSFLFREAAQAHINSDEPKLGQVLDLISYHRDTWRMACDMLKADTTVAPSRPSAPHFDPSDARSTSVSLQA